MSPSMSSESLVSFSSSHLLPLSLPRSLAIALISQDYLALLVCIHHGDYAMSPPNAFVRPDLSESVIRVVFPDSLRQQTCSRSSTFGPSSSLVLESGT
ncbi:hypothetical protein QCA50_013496 [Cerrena zonata]|uniref:Uncharacterized protein n=1 Tax=Cerrena zonata TaxID=2478898 RepID=A0AAW0FUQ2_9APHY